MASWRAPCDVGGEEGRAAKRAKALPYMLCALTHEDVPVWKSPWRKST